MKRFRTIITAAAAVCAAIVPVSCESFFDVRPKSQILVNRHFTSEAGFSDQLTGAYTQLTSTDLYGQEMTFGLMSVLSQDYALGNANAYVEASRYNYYEPGVRARIDGIWSGVYNTIANLNVMLEYMDDADPAMFTDDNWYACYGGALGLRAFLHFDLLRIFAPVPSAGADKPGIPYVKAYGTAVTPQGTVRENLADIKEDLLRSIDLLSNCRENTDTLNNYMSRNALFNYYASLATMARVCQWEGDLDQAAVYAQKVIDVTGIRIGWVDPTSINSSNPTERDLTFSHEHVFRLTVNDMDEVVLGWFTTSAGSNKLAPSEAMMDEIYEITAANLGSDYRNYYHYSYSGETKYYTKFWQYENGMYLDKMPLIRLSEMYYIAAEACASYDPARAVTLLNTVRAHRGLTSYPLPQSMSGAKALEEVYKEYRKEFIGEGQLFYLYKRLGYTTIPGSSVPAGDNVYVLPMPDNEVEFGNRKN